MGSVVVGPLGGEAGPAATAAPAMPRSAGNASTASAGPINFAILRARSAATLNVHPRTPRAAASLGPRLARYLNRHSGVVGEVSAELVGVPPAAATTRSRQTPIPRWPSAGPAG